MTCDLQRSRDRPLYPKAIVCCSRGFYSIVETEDLFLNGFRLFRDRTRTMEASIWTPSVETIKFNVKKWSTLKTKRNKRFSYNKLFCLFLSFSKNNK